MVTHIQHLGQSLVPSRDATCCLLSLRIGITVITVSPAATTAATWLKNRHST